jgi:L-amino acid N-acyltransferase YncA
MEIRDAASGDLPGILAIYNEVIVSSTAIYQFEPVDLDNRRRWFEGRLAAGYPVLAAIDAGQVVGFASFGDWRSSPGYAWTVEHTVHVRDDRRGQGVGRSLVEALIDRATALGKHVMIGGVDADNAASLAFHRRLGFEPVAHFQEVGRKFDRWLDLVFVQRRL